MFKVGDKVLAEVDTRENPWADHGTVVKFAGEVSDWLGGVDYLYDVQWPDNELPVTEFGSTLVKVNIPNRMWEPAGKDEKRIAAYEWAQSAGEVY